MMHWSLSTTNLGAEGIHFEDGVNMLIANNVEEFFDAIHHCITDEAYCKQIGLNARKLVEEQHDTNKVTGQFVEFYKTIV